MTPLLAALKYAKNGWSVIPIEPRGKKPLLKWETYQIEAMDADAIKACWDTWPCANVGVVTGAVSGIVVVDLDTNDAKNAIKAMIGENRLLAVPRVKTGRGWQLFFAHPATPLPNKAGVIPGLDVRGDGGYVVAPPSLHPNGKTYKWEVALTDPLPPIPAELLSLISSPSPVVTGSPSSRFDTASALRGVPEGQRDETLFKLACTLRGAGVPLSTARDLVLEAAANCEPPFDENVATDKVARAYAKYQPREAQPKQASFWPELISMKSLIDSPPDPTEWLWDRVLPVGNTSIVVAKPKVGKSNFAVNLAIAVARGVPFLDRDTKKAKVAYLSLDASLQEISDTFAKFGVKENDDIMIHAGTAPSDAVKWITQRVTEQGVGLVIIDTLQRLFRFGNINDYAEVNNAVEPLLASMAQCHCHVLFVHHAKKDSTDDLDSAVGSTAIRGLCYSYIHLKRLPDSETRVIKSDQRAGENIPELALTFDYKTGWLKLNGTLEEAMVRDVKGRIRELLDAMDRPLTESQVQEMLQSKAQTISVALREMFKSNELDRSGVGHRGDAFKYTLAKTFPSMKKITDIFPGAKVMR